MDEVLRQTLKKLNIEPTDLGLYQTAFTHRSFLNEANLDPTGSKVESNERLEFLGDSVLSFIVSDYLFKLRPQDAEGDLTNLRAYLVKSQSLAKISKNLGLGQFLRLSKGEESSAGRQNLQILANTFESLLGAIFLDLGIEAATSFVHQTLLEEFRTEISQGAPKDPKSTLQEQVQSKFQLSPKYVTLDQQGPDHAKQFKVGVYIKGELIGEGTGSNKHKAEQEAAKAALVKLEEPA